MKILYDNILNDASTLTADSENYNFPITNVLVLSSDIEYRSVVPTGQAITFEFGSNQTIDCLAIANHNLSVIKIELFLATVSQLDTGNITTIYDTDVLYFDETICDEIKITVTSTSTYSSIGYLSAGLYLQMPDPIANYGEGLKINSKRFEADFGSVYGADGVVLRQIKGMSFIILTKTEYDEIMDMIYEIKNYGHLFIDVKDSAHDITQPIYGTMTVSEWPSARYSIGGYRYTTTLNFLEAK